MKHILIVLLIIAFLNNSFNGQETIEDKVENKPAKKEMDDGFEKENDTDKSITNKFSLTGFIMFIISIILITGIICLILLSTYYRIYLFKNKQAPFNAPLILQLFFPKPVNYEHEIAVLCSKYMDN